MSRPIALALLALVAAAAVADAAALPKTSWLSKGRTLLQGWPRPSRSYCTPQGLVVVAPYSLSVGNLVGGNLFMPNVYTRGRGNCIRNSPPKPKAAAADAPAPAASTGRKLLRLQQN